MLESIPQTQLIDEDRAQSESSRVGQAFGQHLALPVEDPFS